MFRQRSKAWDISKKRSEKDVKAALRIIRTATELGAQAPALELRGEPIGMVEIAEYYRKKLKPGQSVSDIPTPSREDAPTPLGLSRADSAQESRSTTESLSACGEPFSVDILLTAFEDSLKFKPLPSGPGLNWMDPRYSKEGLLFDYDLVRALCLYETINNHWYMQMSRAVCTGLVSIIEKFSKSYISTLQTSFMRLEMIACDIANHSMIPFVAYLNEQIEEYRLFYGTLQGLSDLCPPAGPSEANFPKGWLSWQDLYKEVGLLEIYVFCNEFEKARVYYDNILEKPSAKKYRLPLLVGPGTNATEIFSYVYSHLERMASISTPDCSSRARKIHYCFVAQLATYVQFNAMEYLQESKADTIERVKFVDVSTHPSLPSTVRVILQRPIVVGHPFFMELQLTGRGCLSFLCVTKIASSDDGWRKFMMTIPLAVMSKSISSFARDDASQKFILGTL